MHDPVHMIWPFVSVVKWYRVWPFGPVRTFPTDVAVPELTVRVPPLGEVVPEAPGDAAEEVEELEAEVPELQAAAVTATAAKSARSAQRFRPEEPLMAANRLASEGFMVVELGMFSLSELG